MENFCTRIICILLTLSQIECDDDEKEVYIYGLLSFVYTAIPFSCLLIVSFIMNMPVKMLLWLSLFLLLRKNAGGLHSKNPFFCLLYSLLLGISVFFICPYFSKITFVNYLTCILLTGLFLFFVAPATHKQFSTQQKRTCKLKLLFTISLVSITLYFFPSLQSLFLHALISTSLLCLAHVFTK